MSIKVNARPYAARRVTEAIPYGLAVSLEVAEGVSIRVYEEIRERLLVPIAARVSDR